MGQLLIRMNNSLKHRGPDDAGYWLMGEAESTFYADEDSHTDIKHRLPLLPATIPAAVGFGHRRLSIIDLSTASHQPFQSKDKRYILCYNGELYNYIELRATLIALGHTFSTNGDAEVLLAAWQQWQEAALDRFEGMWAFALYDLEVEKLWLVRDPSGVKPLFYSQSADLLLFASEPKALLASGLVSTKLHAPALYSFVVHGALDEAAGHLLAAVNELPAGHWLTYHKSNGVIELKNYHSGRLAKDLAESALPVDLIGAIKTKLQYAVDLRLRSDVKVGASLSGGLDSATLAALAAKSPGFPLFTAVYEGFPENEAGYAREVAEKVQANWIPVAVEPKLIRSRLEAMVHIQDGPLLALSTFAQLLINETAKANGVTILLDGQGGDELCSGYDRYWLSYYRQAWEKWNWGLLRDGLINSQQRKYVLKAFVYAHASDLLFRSAFRPLLRKQLKRNKTALKYLQGQFQDAHWPVSLAFLQQMPESGVNAQQMNEMYGFDLKNLLRWGDRNSMSVAIENRVPFADDPHLAQLLFRLPTTLKMGANRSKILLRAAMEDRLPAKIINRSDKQGFTTPMQAWMTELWPDWKVYLKYLPETIDIKAVERDHKALLTTNTGAALLLRLVSLGAWLKNLQESAKSA